MKYSLPGNEGIAIEVGGKKDNANARKKALEQVQQLVQAGELELASDFDADMLIPLFPPTPLTEHRSIAETSDPVVKATAIACQLAKVKVRLEENIAEATAVYGVLERVFQDSKSLTENDIITLQAGMGSLLEYAKTLKEKAEISEDVEVARSVLSELLAEEHPSSKLTSPTLEDSALRVDDKYKLPVPPSPSPTSERVSSTSQITEMPEVIYDADSVAHQDNGHLVLR